MSFFNNLNFTSSNEDGQSELKALKNSRRRLVCLTGSGTRPLDMLFTNAEDVIALDINPAQNALLALKIAAISTLDYNDYLKFIGVEPSNDRGRVFEQLRPYLSPDVAVFWDKRKKLINAGLWYNGLWEKVLRASARVLKLARGKQIKSLFAAQTLDEQEEIWQQIFNHIVWRQGLHLLSYRFIWTHIIGEPGGAFLPAPNEIKARLNQSFSSAARTFFFRNSDFASLILRGHHNKAEALPLHMKAENYPHLRKNLGRLRLIHGGIHQLGELGIDNVDGFSLSDFSSYCNNDAYKNCWQSVLNAALPGAEFCERVFMNTLELPFPSIHLDKTLSSTLSCEDLAIIYSIRAGILHKKI